ncbi:MAG TPA: cytidine deaminase [Gemmatimonadaceae bacterium]|jgi:cytidine deaminase|nr:cytidine deaminase [Gemmatimonadaceae bacterium]
MTVATLESRLPTLSGHAAEALERAYAPYSHFRVGAALLAVDGTIVIGCNVENASYPAGNCAERVALGAAVTAGLRRFTAIAICTDAPAPTPPCGICRQALAEFGMDVIVVSTTTAGLKMRWTLKELLPHPFTPSSLHS